MRETEGSKLLHWRMDFREIIRTVKPREDDGTITYDMRPFGNRQGEAVDCFLREQLAWADRNEKFSNKKLVLICDANAEIPDSVNERLSRLNAKGVLHELRRL